MHTAKEYIMLSILSYCNFNQTEHGKTIFEIFKEDVKRKYLMEHLLFLTLNMINSF